MICYNCKNACDCKTFMSLYSMSKDFSINNCRQYESDSAYKYKRIAEHDELMRLIYDYFTDQIEGEFSDEEIKEVITRTILSL